MLFTHICFSWFPIFKMNAYTVGDRTEIFVPRFHCRKISLKVVFHNHDTKNSLDEIIREIKRTECVSRESFKYKIGLFIQNDVSLLTLHLPFKDLHVYNGEFVNTALNRLTQSAKNILTVGEDITIQFTVLKKAI